MKASAGQGSTHRETTGVASVIATFAIVAALLFAILMALPGPARAYAPQGGIEPNPALEGNVTFASHLAGAGALAYTPSGGGNGSLGARLDPRVANPIQVNPSDIIAPGVLQAEKVGGVYWNTTSTGSTNAWSCNSPSTGGIVSTGPTLTTVNNEPAVQFTTNGSGKVANTDQCHWNVPLASWPSQNAQFDFITMIATFSGPAAANLFAYVANTGATGSFAFSTQTGLPTRAVAINTGTSCTIGSQLYYSVPLASISSATVGLNASGTQTASSVFFGWSLNLPTTSTTAYTVTVTGLDFTLGPLVLGNTTWNKTSMQREVVSGTDNLSSLQPSFGYSTITGGGYVAAIQQQAADLPSANVSLTSSPVNIQNVTSGGPSYVDQVTYDFSFGLPVAPGLTYGTFKLIDSVGVAGQQYVSVAFGGTSYTAAYGAYATCTTVGTTTTCTGLGKVQTVSSAVGATTGQSWIGVVEFTQSQWNGISAPPGLFSAGGIEYWWFIVISGLLSLLGVGSAWAARNTSSLRVRKGVGMPIFGMRGPPRSYNFRGRRLSRNKLGMAGRHAAAISVGLVGIGAGVIALWAWTDGADLTGIAGSFIAGLLLLFVLAAIAFGGYEIHHHMKKRAGSR